MGENYCLIVFFCTYMLIAAGVAQNQASFLARVRQFADDFLIRSPNALERRLVQAHVRGSCPGRYNDWQA
jgi:hypothetical protein